MKALRSLIKIRKYNLDLIIKDIKLYDQKILKIDQDLDLLSNQLLTEQENFSKNIEYALSLEIYINSINETKNCYMKQKKELIKKIDALRVSALQEFYELKKIQLVLKNYNKKYEYEIELKENDLINELNMIIYHKNHYIPS